MSDHYEAPDPWAEVPERMDLPTPEVQDPFRDGDDDFDYEAYYNATRATVAEKVAPLGDDELSLGARHVDEGRRTTPATPIFDGALKARQEDMAAAADRDSAGRMRTLLGKIRRTDKKSDVGLNGSDARGLEHSRGRGYGRGR